MNVITSAPVECVDGVPIRFLLQAERDIHGRLIQKMREALECWLKYDQLKQAAADGHDCGAAYRRAIARTRKVLS